MVMTRESRQMLSLLKIVDALNEVENAMKQFFNDEENVASINYKPQ